MQLKKSLTSLKDYSKLSIQFCPDPSAVIDIGTNTIRLLIGCVKEGKVMRLATDRAVTRLGKGILKTGKLNKTNAIKSIKYILKFKEKCDKYGVRKIRAIGTSALREAKNSDSFLTQVKEIAGIDIDIISGKKEAELTLKGTLSSLSKPRALRKKEPKAFFIVDIGGGSTECIFHKSKTITNSIPIGAVKLFDAFVKHDPPTLMELKKMKAYIEETYSKSLSFNHSSLNFIATGGTATTLAAIDMGINKYDGDKVHMHKITLHSLKSIYKKMATLPMRERSKIKGLDADRADIIIPGIIILLTLMEEIGAKTFIVSDYGLLEGALLSCHML